jgi:predicted transglutaminase-like cysteine proteinase
MSNLHDARRAAPLFAIGLSVGLLACLGNTKAGELAAPPHEILEFKIVSAAPFEEPRDAPDYRLSEPFGLESSALVTGGLQNNVQNKWSVVAKELLHEREILARCRADVEVCPPAAKKFLAIVDKALIRGGLARIGEINRAINLTVRWVDDMTQYGVPDFWATPLTTFASEAGNCKDYAIAKYVALQEMGISADDLRLIVVRDRPTHQLHAVAAVHYDGRWLILDNRTFVMVQDVDIATYKPLFLIDTDSVKRMIPATSKPQDPKISVSSAEVGLQFSSGWQNTPLLL